MNILKLLEEIRGIAQNGLYYSKNEYDQERYNQLLNLCSKQYSNLFGFSSKIISETFLKDIGHVTPKIGVNAAIYDGTKLLVTRRSDDNCWELPGGWAELGETPYQTVERELKEETSLCIKVQELIDVFTRIPGDFNQTFTSYHLLFKAIIVDGIFETSLETTAMKFITKSKIADLKWHKDHNKMAEKVFEII